MGKCHNTHRLLFLGCFSRLRKIVCLYVVRNVHVASDLTKELPGQCWILGLALQLDILQPWRSNQPAKLSSWLNALINAIAMALSAGERKKDKADVRVFPI